MQTKYSGEIIIRKLEKKDNAALASIIRNSLAEFVPTNRALFSLTLLQTTFSHF